MAVGGSRRAVLQRRHSGASARSACPMSSPACSPDLPATLYAARLSGAGPDTGLGLELTVVTAALLGGNSVGGGRGSIGKALMGAIIVSLLTNGLVRLGLQNGASSMVVGLVLLLAIAIDVRWVKWRHKLQRQSLCVAGLSGFAARRRPSTPRSPSPYAMNDRLRDVEIIGLGEVDGPEDVILDADDNLYCSVRQGEIVRFLAPDYVRARSLCPCRRPAARHGLRQGRRPRRVHRRHGPLSRRQAAQCPENDRGDQSLAVFDHRRFPHAARRRSRHRAGRQGLFQRGDDPLRLRGMGGRRAGRARQRPDHPLRSGVGHDAHDPAQSSLRQRHLRRPRQQVGAVRGNLGLPRQPLLARGPESGNDGDRHRRPSRLSRQYQSRIARNLLGRARRHADAVLRSGDDDAGLPAAHGAAGGRRRMAVSRTSMSAASSISTRTAASSNRFGTSRAKTIRRSPRCASIAAISISAASPTIESGASSSPTPIRTGPVQASYWGARP